MSEDKSKKVSSSLADQMAWRAQKLKEWRDADQAYPNDFKPTHEAVALHQQFEHWDKDALVDSQTQVRLAGRMMSCRLMGKAAFAQLADKSGKIQIYLKQSELPEGMFEAFKSYDLGDILGVEGVLFRTKTNELSVRVQSCRLLTKALRPLPDKYHGLADKETCYRQRYVDLMVNDQTRETFRIRSQLIAKIRRYLDDAGFLEVETPMMHVIPGGATAKPFITHHNALNMPLYLRIAPELYLKRLVVGGFEQVYEINRNFRNEGLSTRHNPEFTMVEFYQAYANYQDLMAFTEDMLRHLAMAVMGSAQIEYGDMTLDFEQPFARYSLAEAVEHYFPQAANCQSDQAAWVALARELNVEVAKDAGIGKVQLAIFEEHIETQLQQPTFITQYPTEVSPLARRSDENPEVTDRFELFIAGREIANGFSELNDAEDQAARFKQQVAEKDAGDEEAMHYDDDYITALEYGMPPTAGEGIGIDRLCMLFTNSHSIKDVILFPHMRSKVAEKNDGVDGHHEG